MFSSSNAKDLAELQKLMEADGWHIWPQHEAEEGWLLECSLYPPPADADKESSSADSGISVIDPDSAPGASRTSFQYSGLSSLFYSNATVPLACIALCLGILYPTWQNASGGARGGDVPFIIIGIAILCMIVVAVLVAKSWMRVRADRNGLWVRETLFQPSYTIAYADICKVKMIREQGGQRDYTYYLGLDLQSGERLDIYIPRKVQSALVHVIKYWMRQ